MRRKREVPEYIRENIKKIGLKINKMRLAKKLSREKLAYSIGMAKSYLGYIEKGQSNPTIETLHLIAGGLECEVKDLL